jgi:hypothetical protein
MTEYALRCPQCDAGDVGELDSILGTAQGCWWKTKEGKIEFEPDGYTLVHWDTQNPADPRRPCICERCGWQGRTSELKLPSRGQFPRTKP